MDTHWPGRGTSSGAEEHVLRILAENEMLRSTVSAYCAMDTKDQRLKAALETTQQLLLRAERREERIVVIYDQMLHKFAQAWARRQQTKALERWAWTAIIRGSRLGWHRFQGGHASRAFRNFAFHAWREEHHMRVRKNSRIVRVLWRRDLQCVSRALRQWRQSWRRSARITSFFYTRAHGRAWKAFSAAIVTSRCIRRAALLIARKSSISCARRALGRWACAAWRMRANFWQRHAQAAREALRKAMQPGSFEAFLLRTEELHGKSPGAHTWLGQSKDEEEDTFAVQTKSDGAILGAAGVGDSNTAKIERLRQPLRAGGSVVQFALDAEGGAMMRTPQGSTRYTPPKPPPSEDPVLRTRGWKAKSTTPPPGSPKRLSSPTRNPISTAYPYIYSPGLSKMQPQHVGRDGSADPRPRLSDDSDDYDVFSPVSPVELEVPTIQPVHAWPPSPTEPVEKERDNSPVTPASIYKAAGYTTVEEKMGRKDDVPESPMLCLPNSEVKGLLIKWNPQPRAIAYELRYRFRRLDNLFWGAWISMSNAIEATKILLPARKDAVYCFQVRAKTADKGWGAWSDSSAVLRSTSTGGLEYAASVELDGSMAKSLEEQKKQHSEKTAHESATPRRPFAAAPSSSSSSLSSSTDAGGVQDGSVESHAAKLARGVFSRKSGKGSRTWLQGGGLQSEMMPDISVVENLDMDNTVLSPASPAWGETPSLGQMPAYAMPYGLQSSPPTRPLRGSPPPPTPEAQVSKVGASAERALRLAKEAHAQWGATEAKTPTRPQDEATGHLTGSAAGAFLGGSGDGRGLSSGTGILVTKTAPFRIVAVQENSPAAVQQGIDVGDILAAIDGVSVAARGLTDIDVYRMLSGDQGSTVTCGLMKGGWGGMGQPRSGGQPPQFVTVVLRRRAKTDNSHAPSSPPKAIQRQTPQSLLPSQIVRKQQQSV